MTPRSRNRYFDLKAQLESHLLGECVAEKPAEGLSTPGSEIDERIVQGIWHEQLLHADKLITCSKKPVRVIDPGQWNSEGGPDFKMAELEIAGKRLRGDIEIHVNSTDWERHCHERDFEYNGVILHVFLRNSDGSNFDTLHNGAPLERLELLSALDPDLETIRRSLSREDFLFAERTTLGRCHASLSQLDQSFVEDFFREAGRQRMEEKIARLAAQRVGETPDQTLYQAIMTAMGYKGGKTLFFLLAKRTPIEELKDYLSGASLPELPLAIEAILLNVANLLHPTKSVRKKSPEDVCDTELLDVETQKYLNRTNEWWSRLSGYYTDRIIPPTNRWYGNVRPVNFPSRRIAGVARLLANFDFRRGILDGVIRRFEDARGRQPKSASDFKREIKQLADVFAAEGDSYWSNRYTLGGKPSPKRMQLIGEERASSVLLNAVMPAAFMAARERGDMKLEEFLWRLFDHFPALPQNAITKFMRHRLFGPSGGAFLNFRRERTNQALFQIFHDCCNNNALTCDDCCFYAKASAK